MDDDLEVGDVPYIKDKILKKDNNFIESMYRHIPNREKLNEIINNYFKENENDNNIGDC